MRYALRAGFLLAGCLGATALLHVYWAVGGTWALQESIGEGNPVPPTWSMWVVGAGLGVAAAGVLGQIGVWGARIPSWIFRVGSWILFACLVVVTALNASTGRPWEMFLIAPFCALLSVLAFVVALKPKGTDASA